MGWVTEELIDAILHWFAGVIVGAIELLWELLASSVFVSPDVTQLPQVRSFAGASLAVVNTTYILAFLATTLLIMGRGVMSFRYGPGELIPRLVVGLIAANFGMPLCATLIEVANALTGALTSQDITAPGSMQQLGAIVTDGLTDVTGTNPAGLLVLLIGGILAVLTAMLIMQWIVRLGVLIVAVGVAPIALALHGTPFTEPAAKLWWRTLLGTLGTVVLQAVALHTTLTIFLDPGANLSAVGLPDETSVVMNLLIVLCLLWAILKIPAMMRRYVTKSTPGRGATIVRVLLMQQITRGLSRVTAAAAGRGSGPGRRAGGPGADPPWPTRPTRRGSGGTRGPRPAASAARPAASPQALSRAPAGAGPGVVAVAYPTSRPVKPYTPGELAAGVDLYTRSLKRRATAPSTGRTRP